MSSNPFFDDDSPVSPIMSEPGLSRSGQHPQPQRYSDYQALEVVRSDIDPEIHTLYESSTGTYQCIVVDPLSRDAVIIDPVLNRNPQNLGINTTAADRILQLVHRYKYNVVRILATHSMPEHPTSAWYLRTQLRDRDGHMPRICTGKAISGLQRMFAKQYQVEDAGWSSRFDSFQDGQIFAIGNMRAQVVHLLQQPDWYAFVIGKHVFLGQELPNQEFTSIRPTQQMPLRKLAGYRGSHTFHPESATPEDSRPGTSQSGISTWMYEPLEAFSHIIQPRKAPKSSISMSRIFRGANSNRAGKLTGSRTSSRTSYQRPNRIPELA